MLRSFASSVAVLSLVLLVSGCAAQKREKAALVAERDQAQSQYKSEKEANDAARSLNGELEKRLATLTSELSSVKDQLNKAVTDAASMSKVADSKATTLQTALDDANAKLKSADESGRSVAAALSETKTKLISSQDQLTAITTTSKAQTEQVASMSKQIESLNKEIDALKTKLAAAITAAAKPTTQP